MKKLGKLILILLLIVPFSMSCGKGKGDTDVTSSSVSSIASSTSQNSIPATSDSSQSSHSQEMESSSFLESSVIDSSSATLDSSDSMDSSLASDSSSEQDSSVQATHQIIYYMVIDRQVMGVLEECKLENGNYPTTYTAGVGARVDDLKDFVDMEDYTLAFLGWYTDRACTIPFDGTIDVAQTGSLALYAKMDVVFPAD